jgi:hypothetical protein
MVERQARLDSMDPEGSDRIKTLDGEEESEPSTKIIGKCRCKVCTVMIPVLFASSRRFRELVDTETPTWTATGGRLKVAPRAPHPAIAK